jgi:hypothetical protein
MMKRYGCLSEDRRRSDQQYGHVEMINIHARVTSFQYLADCDKTRKPPILQPEHQ